MEKNTAASKRGPRGFTGKPGERGATGAAGPIDLQIAHRIRKTEDRQDALYRGSNAAFRNTNQRITDEARVAWIGIGMAWIIALAALGVACWPLA